MLKYVGSCVVFQEIPDEITLSVNLSNCPCRCPGCHSRYLWENNGIPLTCTALDELMLEYGVYITCVCFMGGDADPAGVNLLAEYLHQNYPEIRVAWYSGRTVIPSVICKTNFNYIKLGPYIEHLGGLSKRGTNQRMYSKDKDGNFIDITYRFWGK